MQQVRTRTNAKHEMKLDKGLAASKINESLNDQDSSSFGPRALPLLKRCVEIQLRLL
jgi:hypothetical protein